MENTINERIKKISNLFFDGNTSAMARATRVKQATLRDIIGERQSTPSFETLKSIVDCSSIPVSSEWLLTGKGAMLIDLDDFEEGEELNSDLNTRPRIPLTAAAGSLSGESIGVTLEQCEQMPLIHQIPSYDFTMFIKGDSMSPRFESGDEIACRRIDQSRFIQWGKVHVLDTTQGFIIKRIYDDGDKIRCVSYNKDYADFSVPKEDIHSISLVVGSVSIMEM